MNFKFIDLEAKDNLNIKEYKKISAMSKERRRTGLFCVEGKNALPELLKSGRGIKTIFFTDDFYNKNNSILEKAAQIAENSYRISEKLADFLSETPSPQGVFAIASFAKDKISTAGNKTVILEKLQDCGNIGTIIRTAYALGFDSIYTVNCGDIYSQKTIRASANAVINADITDFGSIGEAATDLKKDGFTIYCAALEDRSKDIKNIEFAEKTAVIIGNEGSGISDEAKKISDVFIKIPMEKGFDSLNAAVSAAIIMWEIQKKG